MKTVAFGPRAVSSPDTRAPGDGTEPCCNCAARENCLRSLLPGKEDAGRVCVASRVQEGQSLYRAGAAFTTLYVLQSGSFKSVGVGMDGLPKLTGIHLPGEIVGAEGLAGARQTRSMIALEEARVCAIPFEGLRALGRRHPELQRWIHRVMGRTMVIRSKTINGLRRCGRADERLAAFLLDLAERLAGAGPVREEIRLPITRREIGSHLGVDRATVSRAFAGMERAGLLRVSGKEVQLVDRRRLAELARGRDAGAGRYRPQGARKVEMAGGLARR